MSQSHHGAKVIGSGLLRLRDALAVWQEKATTLASGRAKTTGFEPGAVESAEAWALVDGLDSIAVNDPVALIQLGGKPVTLGKIVRGALGMARIRRHIALTGPQATFALIQPAAGTGASLGACDGNDSCGFIEINAGSAPAAGSFLSITFASARENSKYNLILTPRSNSARSLGGVVGQTSTGAGGCNVDTRTALGAGTLYQWGYQIVGFE